MAKPNKRFDFASKAFAADKFDVVKMEGTEAISQLFRFTLTLVTNDAQIDVKTMLANKASLSIYTPDGSVATVYHGVLCEMNQLHEADGYVFYRAVLVPRLWNLSLCKVSEVYLYERTTRDIISGVLSEGRPDSYAFTFKLHGEYRPRSFVCQYQESHLAFISRWMEKEGMYYYFEHDNGSDELIVLDHVRMHAAHALEVRYRPADQVDIGNAPDSVHGFVCRQKPLPQRVLLKDSNHRQAGKELSIEEKVDKDGVGTVMLYGENFRTEEEGKRFAKLRAEQIVCNGKVFAGEGTAVGLRSGQFIDLVSHYRADFNARYLVTAVRHEGSQAGALLSGVQHAFGELDAGTIYRSSFDAIPAAVQYRAPLLTERPRLAGTMTATIDAEGSGDYAELDEFGQYKVQLPFDLTDKQGGKGSAPIRMATPYSGSNHGLHFPLHAGAEVLLSFIDGDPDQPVILGAVPNSRNPSLVNSKNPHDSLITTSAGNQLRMVDTKGEEVIWINSPQEHSSIGIGAVHQDGDGSSIVLKTKNEAELSQLLMVKNVVVLTVGDPASPKAKMTLDGALSGDATKMQAGIELGEDNGLFLTPKVAEMKTGKNIVHTSEEAVSAHFDKGSASMKLDQSGLELAVAASKVTLAKNSLDITVGASKMAADAASIQFKAGSAQVELSAAGLQLKGALIKLG